MRIHSGIATVAIAAVLATTAVAQTNEKVAAQKKEAESNWAKVDSGTPVHAETAHLLLYGSLPDAKLKELGTALEDQYSAAFKLLQFDEKEELWSGKLTAYVFTDRTKFASFLRRIEKRSPMADDNSSVMIRGDTPYIAVGPSREKEGPSAETLLGYQLATALLRKKAGIATRLPDWLVTGFARSTVQHVSANGYDKERVQAQKLAAKRMVADAWNGSVSGEDGAVLATSVVYYLSYGPATKYWLPILAGFKPEEGTETKSVEQAMMAANIKVEILDKLWKQWLKSGK